jgi:hypothetical protein
MDLIVSTPLHVFRVNPFSKSTSIIRTGDGYYFGITHRDGCLVLTHTSGYLQYYKTGGLRIRTERHLIDPHQAEWIEDYLLVANTGKNCLTIFDKGGRFIQDLYLNSIRYDRMYGDRSGNHFNSVHRVGDRVYVIAHNYDKPSEVYELTWPELEVVKVFPTSARMAHNIWSGEWGLVICDSKNSSLCELSSGDTIWKSEEAKSFSRGLAVSEDTIFIGYSDQSVRKQRYWTTGGIWIVDRKSLKTIDKILFPGSGQVNEIRIIGSKDECHNGQIIQPDILSNIVHVSPLLKLGYEIRRSNPVFQRDIILISQILRIHQIVNRWKVSGIR